MVRVVLMVGPTYDVSVNSYVLHENEWPRRCLFHSRCCCS